MVNAFNCNDTSLFQWQPRDSGLQNKDRKKSPLDKGPKKRELSIQEQIAAKEREKHQHNKKFLHDLKKSLAQDKVEITDKYREYLEQGYKIYEQYTGHPWHENFKGLKKEELEAAQKFDKDMFIRNQTYAWYFRTMFEDLAKYIPAKEELEKIRVAVLNDAKAIVNDIACMIDSIEEYQFFSQKSKETIDLTIKRKEELKNHLKKLEDLKDSSVLRKLQKSNIDNNFKNAQKRATSLEGGISAMKKHQENTENSIKNHMDKAKDRLTAAQEKEKAVIQRIIAAQQRAATMQKLSFEATQENGVQDLDMRALFAEKRAKQANERAAQAQERATKANERVEEARISGFGLQAAEQAAETAQKIATLEKKAAEKANELVKLIHEQKNLRAQGKMAEAIDVALEEAKARDDEHNLLKEIHKELEHEAHISDQEKVPAQTLRKQAEGDFNALKNLRDEQKHFQEALKDLAQKERLLEAAVRKTQEASTHQFKACKAQEKKALDAALAAEEGFEKHLRAFAKSEEAVAGAIGRNALSMKLQVNDCFVQGVDLFDAIRKASNERHEKLLEGPTEAHINVYQDKGWATVNGVWMNLKQIQGWDFSQEHQTTIQFRHDTVKIKIVDVDSGTTQEVQTTAQQIYAKRFEDLNHDTNSFQVSLQFHVTTTADRNAAKMATLIFYDKEKNKRHTQEIDLTKAKSITIKNYVHKDKTDVETTTTIEGQTLPNAVIDHEKARKSYNATDLENQYFINLKARALFVPGGKKIELAPREEKKGIDMTEILTGPEHGGLTLRENGTAEGGFINVPIAGAFDTFNPAIPSTRRRLNEMVRTFGEANLEKLKTTLNTQLTSINAQTTSLSNIEELKQELKAYGDVINTFEEGFVFVNDIGDQFLMKKGTDLS